MTPADDRFVGDVLDGRYEIINRIGRGGMASVYKAKDRRLNRIVAVKIMRDDVEDDPGNADRFDQEAKAVAKLSDVHIVSVFDQGYDRDRPYIVFEYVDGANLKAFIIKNGALTVAQALPMIESMAIALAVAHEAGIIHRDIKPENALISRTGQLKLTDFGLARRADVTSMTVSDGVLGSLSYVSPERLEHQVPVGFASDIYSVSIVVFEMLTGCKPFEGDDAQVYHSHMSMDVPAPSTILGKDGIPAWLDALVAACGRRQPEDRPPDGRDLLRRLRLGMDAQRRGRGDNPAVIAQMGARVAPAPQPIKHTPVAIEHTPQLPGPKPAERVPQQPAKPQPPKPAGPKVTGRMVLTGLLVILTIAACATGSWWLSSGRYTAMPDIVNHTQTDANRLVQNARLTLTTDKAYSETVKSGNVISSDPPAGEKVLGGSSVHAIISQGPERYAVPKLAGLTLDEATVALDDVHLTVGDVTQQYSEKVASGKVISAGESAGAMVKPGTPVDLVVSQGPKPIPVPDYTGKPATDAMDALTKLGLVPSQTFSYSTKVSAGMVISQTPKSGSLHKGDSVTLTVSQGPHMVTIPGGLVNSKSADARKTLTDLGFKVVFSFLHADGNRTNIVAYTDPPTGASVVQGATVTLYIN